jgi:putative SOS response-associated peptidase YedK
MALRLGIHIELSMCGRITQKGGELPGLVTVTLVEEPFPPRWNGAPSQDFWVIRQHPQTGEYRRDRLLWGLIPNWVKDPDGGRKPINARAESITSLPSFRDAYAKRRCLVPIENFFEWRAIKGAKAKQPYAIAMKDGSPFALAGIWESWRPPESGEIVRTFAVITTEANAFVAEIHDRMPVIVAPENYARWLSPIEPHPRDLLVPYPAEPMAAWPISTRVNSPRYDSADILARVDVDQGRSAGLGSA